MAVGSNRGPQPTMYTKHPWSINIHMQTLSLIFQCSLFPIASAPLISVANLILFHCDVICFFRLRALSTKYNSLPQAASRPFDCGRDGFVYVILYQIIPPFFFSFFMCGYSYLCFKIINRIGEGCGVMVLEVSSEKCWYFTPSF